MAKPPLCTSTSVRLSVHFFRAEEPSCSFAVWACEVPTAVMQHAVLLGRGSWMHFYNRCYRSLPPRPSDHLIVSELELSDHALAGVWGYAIDPVTSDGGFHLSYHGAEGVTLPDEPQSARFAAKDLTRSLGTVWSTCSPSLTCPQWRNALSPLGDRSSPRWGGESRAWRQPRSRPRPARVRCTGRCAARQPISRPLFGPLPVAPISAVAESPLTAAAATASPSPALIGTARFVPARLGTTSVTSARGCI